MTIDYITYYIHTCLTLEKYYICKDKYHKQKYTYDIKWVYHRLYTALLFLHIYIKISQEKLYILQYKGISQIIYRLCTAYLSFLLTVLHGEVIFPPSSQIFQL